MHSIVRRWFILAIALLLALTVSVVPLAHALSPFTKLPDRELGVSQGWPVTTQTGFEEGVVGSETDTSTSSGDVQLATKSDWYDTNWDYRKPATVTNNSGGVLTNYQVKVTVNTQELIPAKMQSDGADIRFTQSDGTTLIDYWIESGINTTTTSIWVEVSSIPTGDSTIYVYYGNSGASAASSVSDTFSSGSFTDSFADSTKISSSTNVIVSGGEVELDLPPVPVFISYRSNTGTNTVNSPKTRDRNGSTWDSESELATAGSAIREVKTTYCPISSRDYEKIIVTLSDDQYLDAYVWDGSDWLVTNNIGYVKSFGNFHSAFDIVYEQSSGEAMLAYNISSTDVTREVAYRTWNGTVWSGEAYIDDPDQTTDIDCEHLSMAAKPSSNEISLIVSESTDADRVIGVIWDGSAWGNMQTLTTENFGSTGHAVAVAYEQQSGNAMFAWADTDANFESRIWNGTSWEATLPDISICGSLYWVRWLVLKADPASDKIMGICQDSLSDLNTVYWDGSSWTGPVEHDANTDAPVGAPGNRVVDFEWEPSGSKGLLVWGTTSGSLSYKTWNAGWSGESTITAAGTHPWIQLRRNPGVAGDLKILGATLDSNLDLGDLRWDGTTLTHSIGSITADTSVSDYECFDVAFRIKNSTSGDVTSVTIPTDTNTRFAVGDQLSWNDTAPANTDLTYQLYYYNSTWQLIPDSALPGNSTGFDTSPIDISSVKTEYSQIRLKANFTSDGIYTPSLQDWTMTYYYREYTATEPTAGSPGTEEGPYYALGTIASNVYNTGKDGAQWRALSWSETLPSGNTDITFEVRASNTSFAKDAPSSGALTWISVGGTSPITSGLPSGRYQQWQATLTTSVVATPVLEDVRVLYL